MTYRELTRSNFVVVFFFVDLTAQIVLLLVECMGVG